MKRKIPAYVPKNRLRRIMVKLQTMEDVVAYLPTILKLIVEELDDLHMRIRTKKVKP